MSNDLELEARQESRCFVCKRSVDEVRRLLSGPGASICDECLAGCFGAVRGESPPVSSLRPRCLSAVPSVGAYEKMAVGWGLVGGVLWAAVAVLDWMLLDPDWSSPALQGPYLLLRLAAHGWLLIAVTTAIGVFLLGLLTAAREGAGSVRVPVWSAALLLTLGLAILGGGRMASNAVRMKGFETLGLRLAPVVVRIMEEEARLGHPPTFRDLVCASPPIPFRTGLEAYPLIRYDVISQPDRFNGNRWMLSVIGFYGWSGDRFVFLSNAQYPTRGFAGPVKQLGLWAYVYGGVLEGGEPPNEALQLTKRGIRGRPH